MRDYRFKCSRNQKIRNYKKGTALYERFLLFKICLRPEIFRSYSVLFYQDLFLFGYKTFSCKVDLAVGLDSDNADKDLIAHAHFVFDLFNSVVGKS